jgi:hypothetical protein
VKFVFVQLLRISQYYGSLVITVKPVSSFSQFNWVQILLFTDKDKMVITSKLFDGVSASLTVPC